MDSEGTSVGDYSTVLGAPLEPGDQTEVAWDHQVSSSGDYSVQFSVWEGTPPTEQDAPGPGACLTADTHRRLLRADAFPDPSPHADGRADPGGVAVTHSHTHRIGSPIR